MRLLFATATFDADAAFDTGFFIGLVIGFFLGYLGGIDVRIARRYWPRTGCSGSMVRMVVEGLEGPCDRS